MQGKMQLFKIETILTILTGINFTDKFNDVYAFAYYLYNDDQITTSAVIYLKNDMINHILKEYPELTEITHVPVSLFEKTNWINKLKQKYGETLPISRIIEPVIKNKTK